MTITEARRIFAHLMMVARTRRLTPRESAQLSLARQKLRSDRHSTRNPRKKARRNPEQCPTCGRAPGSPYRVTDARGRVVQGCVDPIHTGHLVGESARWQSRAAARKIQAALKRGRAGKGYGSNPAGMIRMGKLVEIRYYRDHGRAKGFYKHPFKVRPEIFYRPSDNSIFIKG
jgi:hypothetical protein